MRILILIFCITSLSHIGYTQLLSLSRATNWELAGHRGEFVEPESMIDFQSNGGVPDGFTSNNSILADILSRVQDDPVVVYFPNGTYFFSEPIHLKSNVIIRGQSMDSTILLFNLSKPDHLIHVKGKRTKTTTAFLSDGTKNSTVIEVEDPGTFAKGDHIYLFDDDAALITSSWALNTTGQVSQITDINSHSISLNSPLRRDFALNNEPQAVKLQPIMNAGIEMVTIQRLDKTNQQTSNIFFQYASNCWVKCIQSINCNFAHADLRYSSHIEISGSYFHDAFDFGGGGKGYGVILQLASGDCLITENIFEKLRHAMILQAGANGNVLSYNYSTDPYWTGVALPSNAAGDIVLHGNFPYANLFEGNTVQNIVIDNSHGINGKYNTFFRNRVELFGIVMNTNPASDDQNFIGNEITNNGFLMGNYILAGKGHFEYGNTKSNSVLPRGTQDLEETSLYLKAIPDYYMDHANWPPIGLPNKLNNHIIEAEAQYHGIIPPKCSSQNTVLTSSNTPPAEIELRVYPNPATEYIRIELQSPGISQKISQVQILSANGTLALRSDYSEVIDINDLSSGMYFVRIYFSNNFFTVKKLVKQGM